MTWSPIVCEQSGHRLDWSYRSTNKTNEQLSIDAERDREEGGSTTPYDQALKAELMGADRDDSPVYDLVQTDTAVVFKTV